VLAAADTISDRVGNSMGLISWSQGTVPTPVRAASRAKIRRNSQTTTDAIESINASISEMALWCDAASTVWVA